MALAKDKVTGVLRDVPDHYLDHPLLGADLEIYTGEEAPVKAEKDSAKKVQFVSQTTSKE